MMHDMHLTVKRRDACGAFAMMMHKMHDFGMNLKRIREARGLSQRDLADMVGVNQSTIQRAESMDKSAKLETYQLCAQALDVSLSDIFTDGLGGDEIMVLRAFRSSDGSSRRLWLAMANEAATLPEPPAQ